MSNRWSWFIGIAIASASIWSTNCALAQELKPIPDNTLGAESSLVTPFTPDSPVDVINGGAQRGANLFHSFREFNVAEGRGAYFYSRSADIQNILARVTGGNPSKIFGTIGTFGNSNPNLFLINPSGIIFGRNASLNIGGSFVATTANALQFGNRGFFSASEQNIPSPLLTINPSALLFNQINQNAAIQNSSVAFAGKDSAGFNAFGLQVPDGKSLLLVGGNVSMDGGELNAFGGRVELGGLGELGSVALNVDGDNLSLKFPENVGRASVSLTNQAAIYVEGAGGGNIAVNAKNLDILGGSIVLGGIEEGLGTPETIGGDITLNATGEIKVADRSVVFNDVRLRSQGNAGNITTDSASFSLRDGAQLGTSTFGQGNAGNVTVSAKNAVDIADASIFSTVESGAVGKGGNIDINAATLSLIDGAQLVTRTSEAFNNLPAGRGDAGNVNVKVTGAVNIAGENNGLLSGIDSSVDTGTVGNGGNITIDSGSFSLRDGAELIANTRGRGDAGSIAIQARDTVSFDGVSNNGVPSRAASQVGDMAMGNGGSINITTGSLLITNGARLSASTLGQGDASSVAIFARDFVFFNGLDSGVFSIVQSGAVGNGGNITIDSGTVSLNDGATLDTRTQGQGRAGNITVRARDSVSLAGIPTKIVTGVGAGSVGKGGNLDIKATSLSLNDGATLISAIYIDYFDKPAGRGDAGNTNIEVTGPVTIVGSKDGIASGIFSLVSPGGIGNGGNIMISSDSLSLTDGALMSASTSGEGNAGTLKINTANAVSISGTRPTTGKSSGLFTFTNSLNKGGDITINTHSFTVSDGAVLDARTTSNGNGGNIAVNANKVEVLDGGQFLSTTSGKGSAGKITLNATDSIIVNGTDATFDSRITQFPTEVPNLSASSGLFVRSSGLGTAGDIEVFSPKIRLDNQGRLTAESELGNGGNINLQTDLLLLRRGASISTTAGTDKTGGNGGNININAPSGFIVAVPKENSDITANAYTGSGGRVDIRAFGIYGIQPRSKPTSLSDITASSEFGVNGTVELNTPDVDPNSGLVNLPTVPVDTSVAQTCQAGGNLAKNSFIITGRGGLPPNPSEALNADAVKVDLVSLNPNSDNRDRSFVPSKTTTPAPEPIIEATGLTLNEKGEVVLTANLPTTTPHSPWLKPASCRAIRNTSATPFDYAQDKLSTSS
ncbi:MAG: filamentous hemagglutinin N-terminal domain-containing protein [Nostoc sp.]|uniref:two-partner secretion domain-containing protein n=1 Tax=Nostoc sp. TaxID=1180 RepID=UPI002FF8A5E0